MRRATVVALAAAPLTLCANGFRLASQDGFATARGEAFVATADNPSAIYYNPSGITQLEGVQLRMGAYGIYLDPSFTPPPPADTNTFHIEDNLAAVPQCFLTLTPTDAAVSFGLGIYSPYGLGVRWPQNTGFRAVAVESSLMHVAINPVVALKLGRGFSIGGGLTVNYAKTYVEQGLRRALTPQNFFRFEGDGWAVGYNLGVLWQPHEKIAIGAVFRSAVTVPLEGETEAELQPWFHPPAQSARMDYPFPLSAAVGFSYRPTPRWNLEIDADCTDWSSFSTLTIHQSGPWPPVVPQDVHLTMNWEPSWLISFGATRYLEHDWHVSAGYAFSQNAVPDAHYSPLAADQDRHFFSVGVGRKGKRFDLDVAYQFGYGPDRTVTGSTPSTAGQIAGQTADGTYDFISHAVLVSVGIHF